MVSILNILSGRHLLRWCELDDLVSAMVEDVFFPMSLLSAGLPISIDSRLILKMQVAITITLTVPNLAIITIVIVRA